MTTAREVMRNADGMPTLSSVVAEMSKLISDDSTSIQDFERIIKPDPALTVNLLRLANSAYFGMRRQISSVRQAVALLGIERVFELATSASFTRILPLNIPGYEIAADTYFFHCLAVGAMAEQLAKLTKISTGELIFTAGLLHDIGKLAIGTFLIKDADAVRNALFGREVRFVDVEKEIVGTTHVEVGALMVEEWHLPSELTGPVRWHHAPGDAPDDVDRTVVDLIHVADGLAHMMGFGADVGELKRTIDESAVGRLNVKVHDLESAAMQTMDSIREMSRILGGHS